MLEQATAALEAAAHSFVEAQPAAQRLGAALKDFTAAFAALKALPKPSLLALISHVWPRWSRVAEVMHSAAVESLVVPELCRLAQVIQPPRDA